MKVAIGQDSHRIDYNNKEKKLRLGINRMYLFIIEPLVAPCGCDMRLSLEWSGYDSHLPQAVLGSVAFLAVNRSDEAQGWMIIETEN